jgi:hypothetical protein
MNLLQKTSFILISILAISLFTSCSGECENEDPTARIVNNGTDKASVQIKTSEGNTININNVDPGKASPYSSYAPGLVTYTITVSDVDYVETVQMDVCNTYDIIIDAENVITTDVDCDD